MHTKDCLRALLSSDVLEFLCHELENLLMGRLPFPSLEAQQEFYLLRNTWLEIYNAFKDNRYKTVRYYLWKPAFSFEDLKIRRPLGVLLQILNDIYV